MLVDCVTVVSREKQGRRFVRVPHYYLDHAKLAKCGFMTSLSPGCEVKTGDLLRVTVAPFHTQSALGAWRVVGFKGPYAVVERPRRKVTLSDKGYSLAAIAELGNMPGERNFSPMRGVDSVTIKGVH